MKIINSSKRTTIADCAKPCSTPLSKAIGLMFTAKPKALLFYFPRPLEVSLHMLFVFFPIDIILLDEKKKVVELKENLKPWHFFKAANAAKYIIEAPEGAVNASKTAVGDTIKFY
ncbi:DUF192 domain-containing protein [Candidatus Woesearchaeota archaeon]|nr:DUF192 domain-containing protein [Candidatus Woesearchaeota archaeon]